MTDRQTSRITNDRMTGRNNRNINSDLRNRTNQSYRSQKPNYDENISANRHTKHMSTDRNNPRFNTQVPNRKALTGLHHVTAITSSAQKIYDFFTNVLGLRLAKKTVNQDDYETYHLFFTEDKGRGADMTFFDFKGSWQARPGINSITRTSFRVPSDLSIEYWAQRLTHAQVQRSNIKMKFGHKCLEFCDFDGQKYQLISDQRNRGAASQGRSWQLSNVPSEHGITGLGPVFIKVEDWRQLGQILIEVFGFRYSMTEGKMHLFEIGAGGNGASLILEEAASHDAYAYQGHGSVHHLALGTKDPESLRYWIDRIASYGLPHSDFVDRFYFASEYVKVAAGVLFEIATDTPGNSALSMVRAGMSHISNHDQALATSRFWIDQTEDESGITLSLPPHLFPSDSANRAKIAASLRPLDTSDAHHDRKLEKFWTMEDVLKGRG